MYDEPGNTEANTSTVGLNEEFNDQSSCACVHRQELLATVTKRTQRALYADRVRSSGKIHVLDSSKRYKYTPENTQWLDRLGLPAIDSPVLGSYCQAAVKLQRRRRQIWSRIPIIFLS
jgi:hypothetical protein